MTFFEKQQIIADLFNEFWIVCDDELRFASRLHRSHRFSYIQHARMIKPACWFVINQHFLITGKCAGDRNTLFLTTGKCHRMHLRKIFKMHRLKDLLHLFALLCVAQVSFFH